MGDRGAGPPTPTPGANGGGGGGANPKGLDGAWLDAGRGGHFRSQGVIVGISLSTMSTMPAPDPVSAGAWRRWLKDYTGEDGRRPLFEPGGRKTDATLWGSDLNCNKVDYYLTKRLGLFLVRGVMTTSALCHSSATVL